MMKEIRIMGVEYNLKVQIEKKGEDYLMTFISDDHVTMVQKYNSFSEIITAAVQYGLEPDRRRIQSQGVFQSNH